jgi:hypothetical protein
VGLGGVELPVLGRLDMPDKPDKRDALGNLDKPDKRNPDWEAPA